MNQNDASFLKILYTLPIGLMEYVKQQDGSVKLGIVNPEVIRILSGTGFLEVIGDLNPFDQSDKKISALKGQLEGDHIFTVIGGTERTRYIIFIDKSRQKV